MSEQLKNRGILQTQFMIDINSSIKTSNEYMYNYYRVVIDYIDQIDSDYYGVLHIEGWCSKYYPYMDGFYTYKTIHIIDGCKNKLAAMTLTKHYALNSDE